jgi:sodium/potassium-transporting ATPase subunit alpha
MNASIDLQYYCNIYRKSYVMVVRGVYRQGGSPDGALSDLCFVGLVSLMDPPRPEVPGAVQACASAGVQVVMVTGDHPLTAAAIARKVGLLHSASRQDVARERGVPEREVLLSEVNAVVLHGADIDKLTEVEWAEVSQLPATL